MDAQTEEPLAKSTMEKLYPQITQIPQMLKASFPVTLLNCETSLLTISVICVICG
jgi:hypothetical protein